MSTTVADRRSPRLRSAAAAFCGNLVHYGSLSISLDLWGSFKVEGDFFSKADWTWAVFGHLTQIETGGAFTGDGYYGAWIQEEFWKAAINTFIVCIFVVTISLTFGTLGGYALSRST